MTATEEEFAQTLASYEAAAIKTGQWNGTDAVEFSNDGATWAPVWVKTDEHAFPVFARARVHRAGVEHADWQYVSWDESIPAVDDWRALWERKPMKLFGAYAQRSAIRHAFRDVIGDRRDPDEIDPAAPTTGPATPVARDWDAEYRAAGSIDVLTAVRAAVRAVRQNTDPLEELFAERKKELETSPWGEPGTPASEEARTSTGALRQTESERTPGLPRDYLKPSSPKKRNRKRGRR